AIDNAPIAARGVWIRPAARGIKAAAAANKRTAATRGVVTATANDRLRTAGQVGDAAEYRGVICGHDVVQIGCATAGHGCADYTDRRSIVFVAGDEIGSGGRWFKTEYALAVCFQFQRLIVGGPQKIHTGRR